MQNRTVRLLQHFYDDVENGEAGTQEFKFQGWGWVLSSASPFLDLIFRKKVAARFDAEPTALQEKGDRGLTMTKQHARRVTRRQPAA